MFAFGLFGPKPVKWFGRTGKAAVIHDWLCDEHPRSVDHTMTADIFNEGMAVLGEHAWRRAIMVSKKTNPSPVSPRFSEAGLGCLTPPPPRWSHPHRYDAERATNPASQTNPGRGRQDPQHTRR